MTQLNVEQRYQSLVQAFTDREGVSYNENTSTTYRFGSDALKIDGKIFAMVTRGQFVVKLPKKRVDQLIAEGHGQRLDTGKGRLMKEWLMLAPDSSLDWHALANEAFEFVGQ